MNGTVLKKKAQELAIAQVKARTCLTKAHKKKLDQLKDDEAIKVFAVVILLLAMCDIRDTPY